MPELAEILSGAVDAGLKAAERGIDRYLEAVEKASVALDDGASRIENAIKLKQGGVTPDLWMGTRVSINAQLSMTTMRERAIQGQGGVNIGPLSLTGGLTEKFMQGTDTNVAVAIEFERQNANQYAEYAVRTYSNLQTPVLPAGDRATGAPGH